MPSQSVNNFSYNPDDKHTDRYLQHKINLLAQGKKKERKAYNVIL